MSSIRRVGGVDLHVEEAGPPDGPLVILLHGFPDFWAGWRHQIAPLAARGFRVVVPDMRGYNRSAKPRGLAAYHLDRLAADVVGLADAYGRDTFRLVGHDWGGNVAWWTAARHPERLERLAILNAPHPDVRLRDPRQALKGYYALLFQLPLLPELALRAGNFALLRRFLTGSAHPGTFSTADVARHVAAWARPGALTAMLNYYRAIRHKPGGPPRRITPPTLLIWGTQDVFLERSIAEANLALCDRGQALFVDTATHWVQLEAADVVNDALARFFAREGVAP